MIQYFTQEFTLFHFGYGSKVHLYAWGKSEKEKGKRKGRRLRKRKEDRKKTVFPIHVYHISGGFFFLLLDLGVYTQSPVTGLCFHLVLTLLNIIKMFSSHIAMLSWSKIIPHPKQVFYFQNLKKRTFYLIKERKIKWLLLQSSTIPFWISNTILEDNMSPPRVVVVLLIFCHYLILG